MTPSRHRIIRLAETGSTNADAMRFALSGEALPLWVTAERQTAGRGRAGRTLGLGRRAICRQAWLFPATHPSKGGTTLAFGRNCA